MIKIKIFKKLKERFEIFVVNYTRKIKRQIVTQSLINLKRDRLVRFHDTGLYTDKIRIAALELCAYEIISNKIPGSVAEFGVYKGKFAGKINEAFKDRRFYLFDSFSGFDPKQKKIDEEGGFLGNTKQDFSGVTTEEVMAKMKYPQNCVIKKGFFSQTIRGLEDNFSFVSIDADLYEAVKESLEYFYPRLSRGGYVFIHDYNNDDWIGAKKAVHDFCGQNQITFTPLPDAHGTAIISK